MFRSSSFVDEKVRVAQDHNLCDVPYDGTQIESYYLNGQYSGR